ncbi:hypothetical protein [Spartinivicinus poritis]|uniref:Lipid A biosynthesis lauroyl acyltransferase n=1 Tax=Spartinivicinus poritis TaxID=2994640 RepID=A0ABT5U937_9GAMM|nr:hypothetical protein [Spartinivicinus sp. A2-2]MDE1462889.1 hypothetical protein [Spartinivicinus sp. A2-2]
MRNWYTRLALLFLFISAYTLPHRWVISIAGWFGRQSTLFARADINNQHQNFRLLLKQESDIAYAHAVGFFENQYKLIACFFLCCRIGLKRWLNFVNKRITVTNVEPLRKLLAQSQNAILLPFHFGDFISLCSVVWPLLPPEYELVILRGAHTTGLNFNWINKLINTHQLNVSILSATDSQDLKQLLRKLRKQQVVVIIYGDLSGAFGTAQETRFFGKKARFAVGALKIAYQTQCPLLPIELQGNAFEPRKKPCLQIKSPFYVRKKPGVEGQQVYLNAVVRMLEQSIRARPSEWMNWQQVGTYFQPTKLVQ